MRLIDANRLLSEDMKTKYYHLPNGDIAIPIIDIEHAPTVDAVPPDKLCEWLSGNSVIIPCEYCQYFSNQYCMAIGDMNKPCPNSADSWRNTITRWMDETENNK